MMDFTHELDAIEQAFHSIVHELYFQETRVDLDYLEAKAKQGLSALAALRAARNTQQETLPGPYNASRANPKNEVGW